MRIGILLSSKEQFAQAGVRIRYKRVEPSLQRLGHTLELIPIQNLTSSATWVHDVYVISKCYDARALIIARLLSQLGIPVGVDLFDDYFSQCADSRFVRLRYWLRALVAHCAFILCSTARMRDLAREYAPNLPMHVMSDPAIGTDAVAIAAAASSKLEAAVKRRRIDVAWFGIGDNPNFSVGLSDLAAFGSEVDRLRGFGYDVHLEVLTNRRSMTPDNLAALGRLATPYTLEEWDEEREHEQLSRSLLCFLPVNARSFSRVKSLNRAITALTAGVQVLSVGYPLYEPLAPFIYRGPRQFLRDLRDCKLAVRPETAQSLADRLNSLADAGQEAVALTEFLADIRHASIQFGTSGVIAVVHGRQANGDVHKFAQRLGALSVASPFCKADLNYDVRFTFAEEGEDYNVYVASKKADLLAPEIRPMLVAHGKILATEFKKIRSRTVVPSARIGISALAALNTLGGDTAAYPMTMGDVAEIMKRLFPDLICFYAEESTELPWHTTGRNLGTTREVNR